MDAQIADAAVAGTTYERVRDSIRQDIAAGVLAPGARLKLTELVKRYGISPMPIRDALQQLQGEGFIVFSPNRGASVRAIDRAFLWQIYEIRRAIEAYYVVELARRADREGPIAMLRTAMGVHRRALAADDEGRVHDLDWAFHRVIVDATSNAEAVAVLNRHYTMIRPLRVRFGRSPERRELIWQEHRAIISAIQDGDADGARDLIVRHIDIAFQDLLKKLELSA